jgi:hypothetical protein
LYVTPARVATLAIPQPVISCCTTGFIIKNISNHALIVPQLK